MHYFCNCKSETSNVCNAVEVNCLQAMKIVHHYANGCFNWLIYGHQSVNPLKEAFLGGGGYVNRPTDGGVPFWLLNWYPKI